MSLALTSSLYMNTGVRNIFMAVRLYKISSYVHIGPTLKPDFPEIKGHTLDEIEYFLNIIKIHFLFFKYDENSI